MAHEGYVELAEAGPVHEPDDIIIESFEGDAVHCREIKTKARGFPESDERLEQYCGPIPGCEQVVVLEIDHRDTETPGAIKDFGAYKTPAPGSVVGAPDNTHSAETAPVGTTARRDHRGRLPPVNMKVPLQQ